MHHSRLTYGLILAAMCFPLDRVAADEEHFIPDCAGGVEIAHAGVVGVEPDGALRLADGRALVLEGIRLPLMDSAPRVLAEEVLASLSRMVQESTVTFTTTPPKEDRYGRLRVQGLGKQWLQIALLEQGLARVAISPDRDECAPDLYEAEARARAQHLGMWTLPNYQIRAARDMKGTADTFQLIEGRVTEVGQAGGWRFIDLRNSDGGSNRRAFSATIAPEDRRAFRDFDLEELPTRHVRVRGIVQDHHGRLEILLSNPAQIEILDK